MAAWNMVLGDFKKPDNPYQRHKDVEAVFRVAEAERDSNSGKCSKPLQTDRSRSNRPQPNRRKGEDRNSADEQPCEPAEESRRCHNERFSRLRPDLACLFWASKVAYGAVRFAKRG